MSEDISKSKELLGVRVSWQDKKTESDIKIVGGATTVERSGVLASIQMLPVPGNPNQIAPAAFVAGDDKEWHIVIPFDRCKIL